MGERGCAGGLLLSSSTSRAMIFWHFEETSTRVRSSVGRVDRERARLARELVNAVRRYSWRALMSNSGSKVALELIFGGGDRR